MRRLAPLLILAALPPILIPVPPRADDFTAVRYTADFVSAHDGDSILIDRHDRVKIRLFGIDAPELSTNAHGKADPGPARAARDYLAGLLEGKTLFVEEVGMSFERTVARLWVADINGKLVPVASLMTDAKLAKPYP